MPCLKRAERATAVYPVVELLQAWLGADGRGTLSREHELIDDYYFSGRHAPTASEAAREWAEMQLRVADAIQRVSEAFHVPATQLSRVEAAAPNAPAWVTQDLTLMSYWRLPRARAFLGLRRDADRAEVFLVFEPEG